MKVTVGERAALDIEDIFHWIAKENPRAAADMVERIRLRINRLAFPGLAHMGRPGLDEGTRELVEPPYIIVSASSWPGNRVRPKAGPAVNLSRPSTPSAPHCC